MSIYFDPPYLEKSESYLHDMTEEDHRAIAELLNQKTRSRIVISYYDHPLLDELYPHWTKLDCTMAKQLSLTTVRGSKQGVAPEILLINGESLSTEQTLF